MSDGFDELSAIRISGRWWDIPWWADKMYAAEFGLSNDQVESAFAALSALFSEKWAKRQTDGRHSILQELFGVRGLSPFSFLYSLGKDLEVLGEKRLLGNLERRLRNANGFSGARAELSALAQWAEAGVEIQRDAPSGNGNKNCDWKVSDGSVVIYGEVKCVDLSPVNKRRQFLDVPPWEREPVPFDLSAEGDKAMDVVEAYADQIPAQGPGVFMISGNGSAAALPFSEAAGKRILERFLAAGASLRHIAGILVVRTFLFPEHGLVQFVIFVRNPSCPNISMDLLRRGFPSLIIWGEKGDETPG